MPLFNKTTTKLLNKISSEHKVQESSLDKKNIFDYSVLDFNKQFYALLNYCIREQNLKVSDILSSIDLDIRNGRKYLSGERKINRNIALRFLIFFGASYEEVQEIFKRYSYPILYVKNKRDELIIISLMSGESFFQTNELLKLHMQENL